MLADPIARRAAPPFVARCTTPDLLWGYLRSQSTGSGSWAIRRDVMHAAVDPILDALHSAELGPADAVVAGAVARLDVGPGWTFRRLRDTCALGWVHERAPVLDLVGRLGLAVSSIDPFLARAPLTNEELIESLRATLSKSAWKRRS